MFLALAILVLLVLTAVLLYALAEGAFSTKDEDVAEDSDVVVADPNARPSEVASHYREAPFPPPTPISPPVAAKQPPVKKPRKVKAVPDVAPSPDPVKAVKKPRRRAEKKAAQEATKE